MCCSPTRVGFIPLSLAILMILFWRLGVAWKHNILIAVLATAFIQISFANILARSAAARLA